jgi:transposase
MLKAHIVSEQFHVVAILGRVKDKIRTRVQEGVNNKIMRIKRKLYGFHDIRYVAMKIQQAFCY